MNDYSALSVLNITEQAAIAAYDSIGLGDQQASDLLAVDAMRSSLKMLNIQGKIVIGEGERDQAPMLYIGELVGSGSGPRIDIAVDPLEGTAILAAGRSGAMSVIATTVQGGFLHAPDVYMEKIATGLTTTEPIIDLDNSPKSNLANIAKAKKCHISDLVTVILNRPRHQELIAKVREAGSRVYLIDDGDIAAVIATTIPNLKIDVYMGTGGAPEGILAAAALCTTGGQICGRLIFGSQAEEKRARQMGISDLSRQYILQDLASGNVIFAATGITSGSILSGVELLAGRAVTHSIVMQSSLKEIRKITTYHNFAQ